MFKSRMTSTGVIALVAMTLTAGSLANVARADGWNGRDNKEFGTDKDHGKDHGNGEGD